MKPKKTSAKLGKPTPKPVKAKSASKKANSKAAVSKPATAISKVKVAKKKTAEPVSSTKKAAPAGRIGKDIKKATASVAKPEKPTKLAAPAKVVVLKKVVRKPRVSPKAPEPEVPAILMEGDAPPIVGISGPGERYALGPGAPPPHWSLVEQGELPEAYGTKELTITARDPEWLFACWDLTTEQQKEYNQLSADGHLVLKVYLNRFEDGALTEAHVHPESRHWFVHVGRSGCRFVAQIGYYGESGRWFVISSSNATMTPPDTLAESEAVSFATLPPRIPFQELVAAVREAAKEQKPLAEAILEIVREAEQAEKQKQAIEAAKPEEKQAATPIIGRALIVEAVAEAAAISAPGAVAGAFTPEQERLLSEIISVDEVRRVWVGSMEITELVRRQMMGPGQADHGAASLASMAAAGLGQAEEIPMGLMPAGGISSPLGAPKEERSRAFWFNVNAELVIYGATDPNATVQIGNRRIELRKDGTFSYRFALPDGAYDLPITATSSDEVESRSAHLKFSRQTDYQGRVEAHPQDPLMKPPAAENI